MDVGNYDLVRVTGAVGGRMAESLSVRAAGQFTNRDGYLTDGHNDQESISGRLSLLWEPASNVSLFVVGEHTHLGGQGAAPVKRSTLTPVCGTDHLRSLAIGLRIESRHSPLRANGLLSSSAGSPRAFFCQQAQV